MCLSYIPAWFGCKGQGAQGRGGGQGWCSLSGHVGAHMRWAVAQPTQRQTCGWTGVGTVPPVPTKWRHRGWGHIPPLWYKKGGAHGSFRSCMPPYYCPTTLCMFPLYSPPSRTPLQGRGGAHDLVHVSCVPHLRMPHLSHATLCTSPCMQDDVHVACKGWGTQGHACRTLAGSCTHAMQEGHCFTWVPPPLCMLLHRPHCVCYVQVEHPCYVRVERLARLELGGYNQVAWLAVNGASASGTQ